MAKGSWIRVNAVDAHLDAQTVNAIIEKALGERAISVTQKPELRKKIGEAFIEVVTPFVPMKHETNNLRESGRATDDGRVYWTAINSRGENYAGYVFDEEKTRWPEGATYANPSTKHTDPRWTENVQPGTAEWNTFVNNITELIKEEFAKDE